MSFFKEVAAPEIEETTEATVIAEVIANAALWTVSVLSPHPQDSATRMDSRRSSSSPLESMDHSTQGCLLPM